MTKTGDIFQELTDEDYQLPLCPDITDEDYRQMTGKDLQRNIQRTTTDRTYDDEERG